MIYDLKFRAILGEDGEPTGMAVGVYRDITDGISWDMAQERYQQIVLSSDRYTYEYEGGKDLLSIFPRFRKAAEKR